MIPSRATNPFSRRTALASLGGAGLALATAITPASAQDATPTTAGHPIVGTWIVNRDTTVDVESPAVVVFTADGTTTDAGAGFSGAWQPTGPSTVDFNFIGIIDNQDGFSGYVVVAGPVEVDGAGNSWTQTYTVMTVAADGTVLSVSPSLTASGARLQVIPGGVLGTALPEVHLWTPPPADATPTA